ncbi:MAG TPA: MarP family serine protease [Acidimicrobiales bacterium]|nr:MarP family serine protease [Acidimicrobiales bacterium]
MNWVDWVLLVLVALSGVHGLRLGAAMQVLSFGGFWLGLFIGVLLTPPIDRHVHGNVAKTVVAAAIVFGLAGLLGGLGRLLGAQSSNALQRLRLGPVDSAAGAAVAVFATLVITWLVATFSVSSRFTSLNAAITDSRIIRAMDSIMPSPPTVFARIESFLANEGFPVVFTGLPPQTVGPVALPSDASVRAAVVAAAPSTVQVAGAGCGVIQEGSGFVVAPGYVVTNAHVVAGIAHPFVVDSTGRHSAAAMLFDPELDVAVLRVPGLGDPALRIDTQTVGRGASGAVLGYPEGGPFTYGAAGVEAAFEANGLDIYGRNQVTRYVYQLAAVVRPGNSGGPLVEPDGTVIGVVFARSTTDQAVGYALATPAVLVDVHKGEAQPVSQPVSTGGCVSS